MLYRIETDFDRDGAYLMMRDEELARQAESDPAFEPVLRLYTWKPYALSLGYNQRIEGVDLTRCAERGIEVVRRPTGGRAVYHSEELTYAVIERTDPSESISAAHRRITDMLVTLLSPLIDNSLSLSDGTSIREAYRSSANANLACFASVARSEVTFEGKKVIGSAQRRFGNALLQHGSILTGNEHLRLPELLALNDEERSRMRDKLITDTATLSDICKRHISPHDAAETIRRAAEKVMPVSLRA
jgi:lipoate-protein ligase A